MKALNFKVFMKKYKLKVILRMNHNYRKFIIYPYTPEIVKYIQIEDL